MAIRSEHAFTGLYRQQYDDLLRFVRRRAHPDAVDDIVAETFLAAWRRRAELPHEVRPWLFRTARHLMLNASRGDHRQDALAVKIGTQGETTLEWSADDRIDVQSAWRALPAVDQEILALGIWEDLPQAEAAAVIGCSRAAYAMRLTRAKRHLADLLEAPTTATLFPVTR
ncbi:RNA polymerase sigma factor [Glaciihabitans sp. dw_435]|uniref:RNA polymerase sigma factor n=1 Tax=Glaciihabitans sp. dw_435 TaxID=2720081 RepID=UPI001BD34D01|nr:sigma-70 family RNA polymerase sigma factor [Glaciihabitans sp. dw_435]